MLISDKYKVQVSLMGMILVCVQSLESQNSSFGDHDAVNHPLVVWDENLKEI